MESLGRVEGLWDGLGSRPSLYKTVGVPVGAHWLALYPDTWRTQGAEGARVLLSSLPKTRNT